ncbi:MAG TPA: hypothetical protein VFO01_08340 [Trebonia sp.]|nr:hypothetical protein [Trebonia sp.]
MTVAPGSTARMARAREAFPLPALERSGAGLTAFPADVPHLAGARCAV